MEERTDTFSYTYSAEQQEEIISIRKKYMKQEENKMDQLRKLDRQVYQKAQCYAIVLGVIGILLLGIGMSVAMTDIAAHIGNAAMFIAVPVGVVGIVLIALAYPIYNKVMKKERQRIAPEILRLTEELMK